MYKPVFSGDLWSDTCLSVNLLLSTVVFYRGQRVKFFYIVKVNF
jgi:hypothetical protein